MAEMKTLTSWIIIASTFLISWINCNGQLKYSEIEKLGASCYPHDTCSKPRNETTDTITIERCECKAFCFNHDTCCIDSPYVGYKSKMQKRGTCEKVLTRNFDILMVSQCDPRWQNNQGIKSLCENSLKTLKDPIGQSPATNLRSKITYKNYFCALCNYDARFLELWGVKIQRTNSAWSEHEIFVRLEFDRIYETWNAVIWNRSDQAEYTESVIVEFEMPDYLEEIVFPCIPDLVSDCDSEWKDETVKRMCNSYTAIIHLMPNSSDGVFRRKISYRNIHCAICNNMTYNKDTVCRAKYPTAYASPKKPPMSFTLLLDVNLSDGNKVGEINPCGNGKMYDPFFRKCRSLVCGIPGFVLKGEKCVRPK